MKKVLFLVPAFLLLASCNDSNPSPPETAGVFLDNQSVSPFTVVKTSVTFWVSANEVDSVYISDPQTVVLNLPLGTTLVPISSNIGFQGPREPDRIESCANGSESLVYNLLVGEIEDPFNFPDFTSVINVSVIVGPLANQLEAKGAASLIDPINPCIMDFTSKVPYFVG